MSDSIQTDDEDFDVTKDAAEIIELDDGEEIDDDPGDGDFLYTCEAPIYCCAVSNSLLALGTGEDCFILLDYNSKQVILKSQFSDSVHFTRFDPINHQYVCAADMSSQLRVWKLNELDSSPVWQIDTSEITDMSWHPTVANVLFAGTVTGELWMWKIPDGQSKYFVGSTGKPLVCFFPYGHECLAAFKDGSYVKWDLRGETTLASLQPGSSEEPLCMSANKSGTLAFVGLVCGQVAVISLTRPFCIQRKIDCIKPDCSEYKYIESVAFNKEDTLVCVGTALGNVLFFSVADYSIYSSYNIDSEQSVVKIIWRKKDALIAFYDGNIAAVDPRHYGNDIPEEKRIKCFEEDLLDFDLIDDNTAVAVFQSGNVQVVTLPNAS